MYIPMWVIFVALIFGYFYHTNRMKEKRKRREFSPFRIHILPNWYELLKDYKLIDDETWKQLDERVTINKSSGYNTFKHGIAFTVLRSDEESELVYYDSRNSFHSEVDFREDIEDIKFPRENFPSFSFSPKLWIKHGIEGYEIGITTPESDKKVFVSGDENDFIKITTIPYCLFHMSRYRYGLVKPEQIEDRLRKNGWSKNEAHEEWKKDVLYRDIPEELEHKYFDIHYKYI